MPRYNKCKYCGKILSKGWCDCEKFLVNVKKLDRLVPLKECKGNDATGRGQEVYSFDPNRSSLPVIPKKFLEDEELEDE